MENTKIIDIAHPSVKDQVIILLSDNKSLTAKQIHNFSISKFGNNVSYQAIHKLLTEMLGKGILLKQEKNYFLNQRWIDNTKKFFDQVEKDNKATIKEPRIIVIENFSYYEWGRNTLKFLAGEVDKGIVTDAFLFSKHIPWILALQKDDYEWFKKIATISWSVLCVSDTLFDRLMSQYYEKSGHKVFLDANYESNCDLIVYGSKVWQIYFPEKLKIMLEIETKKLKNPEELLQPYYKELMYDTSIKIKTLIIDDQELADNLRQGMKKSIQVKK